MIDHEFRPYADMPHLCVAELSGSGDTCNRPIEEHFDTASTAMLLEVYRRDDDDGDAALEELHKRAMNGDVAAREVLNDHDIDDPNWTPQTGSEGPYRPIERNP